MMRWLMRRFKKKPERGIIIDDNLATMIGRHIPLSNTWADILNEIETIKFDEPKNITSYSSRVLEVKIKWKRTNELSTFIINRGAYDDPNLFVTLGKEIAYRYDSYRRFLVEKLVIKMGDDLEDG